MPVEAVVIGAGGHAVSVAETVTAAGYVVVAFTSDRADGSSLLGRPVLRELPSSFVGSNGIVVLGVGDNWSRQRAWRALPTGITADRLPPVIHPSASVSAFADLAPGTVVMQGAIVGSGARAGVGCLLNTSSVLEHECRMGDFSALATGAMTGGRVSIGDRTWVSIGSVIKHGVKIGADTVVGAASYVNADIADQVVAYGTPARVIRTRRPDEPYL